ncbi:MAG: hypothetical protein IJ893_04620 [Bacteroidales bacterium]|jgi:hypothetical protein|nr:hypothetical protein [Bacteroidales bacterium]MBR2747212.1 hypothetical protein [Bacteroidales bacterium]MBR3096704.1 hypothetical protein [Bacteroidales bacterium]MBR4687122.1 hypothetical protein [Bacteroidales bacterium]
MDQRQKRRALYKTWKKGYYHLCTDGKNKGIFHDEGEYVNAVNAISLLDLLFPVKVHTYEVMKSHLHLLLSGRGADCVAVFDYLKMRIDKRLREDGRPPLPKNYDFRLVPVESEDQMCKNLIYIARNASEVMNIRPGSYLFGSSFMFYSDLPRLLETIRAGDFSARELIRMFRTHHPIPPDRPIHPGLKMALPQGFVDMSVLYKVFPTATQFETRLVKDYESFVEIADQTGEDISFTLTEAFGIVDQELTRIGKRLDELSRDDRCHLAVQLNRKFRLDASILSKVLLLPVHVVSQVLHSKRYGK